MELDGQWLHRLQQFIFKHYNDKKVDIEALLLDTFSVDFIENATNEGYLHSDDNYLTFTITDKLKYSSFPIASCKYDPKNIANKFKSDDPAFILATFNSAKEYDAASKYLYLSGCLTSNNETITFIKVPATLGSFACELYLKSLLLFYKMDKKGHNLFALYNDLPTEEKNIIIDFFINRHCTEVVFIDKLKNFSAAFIEIRYSHERTGFLIDYNFLSLLLDILHERCTYNIK